MKLQSPLGFVPVTPDVHVQTKTLAMAYIVDQAWRDLYETEKGFAKGTIFRELDFPYTGRTGGGAHA